jgi:hypothetical protein
MGGVNPCCQSRDAPNRKSITFENADRPIQRKREEYKQSIPESPEVHRYNAARKNKEIPTIISLVNDITPVARTTDHPWVSAPSTVGSLAASWLGTYLRDKQVRHKEST